MCERAYREERGEFVLALVCSRAERPAPEEEGCWICALFEPGGLLLSKDGREYEAGEDVNEGDGEGDAETGKEDEEESVGEEGEAGRLP